MNRCTDLTILRRSLGVLAIGACLQGPARAAGTDQDFDLACAVSAAAEVATAQAGSEQRNLALEANMFFLGRLSGRVPDTYWSAVVKGKLAELRGKAKDADLFDACLTFFGKQL